MNYVSGGNTNRGLLQGLVGTLGGGVKGGVDTNGQYTPYRAARPFLDRVFNQGQGVEAATRANMAMDEVRFKDALNRAAYLEQLKAQEEARRATQNYDAQNLGKAIMGQLDPNDPQQRGLRALMASKIAEEAKADLSTGMDRERSAAMANNRGVVGDAFINKEQVDIEKALQLLRAYRNNSNLIENQELASLAATNASTQATNAGIPLTQENTRRARLANDMYEDYGMEEDVAKSTFNTNLYNTRLDTPGYIDAQVGKEMAVKPGLAYRGKLSGTFSSIDPGGSGYETRINPITGMEEQIRVNKPAKINTFGTVDPNIKSQVLGSTTPQFGGPQYSKPIGPQLRGLGPEPQPLVDPTSILGRVMEVLKGDKRQGLITTGARPYGY